MSQCPHCGKKITDEDFFRRTFDYISSKFPHLATANDVRVHPW